MFLLLMQVERVQKAGGLYANFASDQSLSYLNGTLPGGMARMTSLFVVVLAVHCCSSWDVRGAAGCFG